MDLAGRKLGLLVSVGPEHPNFEHCVRLAQSAREAGVEVYLYCLDDAVRGVIDERLQHLRAGGLKLLGCAYAARQRKLVMGEEAVYAGRTMLSDLMGSTDKFVGFH